MESAQQKILILERQVADLQTRLQVAERDAATDLLTGIPNRRVLDRELAINLADADRNYFDLVVVEIDLDHFKAVNDTYGHQQGDEVLKGFVQAVQQTLRDTDIFGRWGGEEFLLILPMPQATEIDEIADFFKRLQTNVSGVNRSNQLYKNPEKLTISLGAVIIEAGKKKLDPEQVLRQVDATLYESKKTRDTYTIRPYQEDYLAMPV